MFENKIKHIAALCAWAALHAYYLAFHFSWSNFTYFAMVLIYLLCTTVVSKKSDETHVVGTLGNMLGASFALLLGYYIITSIFPIFNIPESADLSGIFTAIDEQLRRKFEASQFEIGIEGIKGYTMLTTAVVIFFMSKSSKHPILGILFKYLWTGCVFAALIDANYGSKDILLLYVVCTLLFVACDIMNFQHDGSRNKAGKRWYNILNILLLLTLMLRPEALIPFTQEGYVEYYFLICGFKWNTALYILVVLVIAGMFMIGCYEPSQIKSNTDIFVFWNAIFVLIATFFFTRYYVGYWWVVALLYVIGIAIVITILAPTKVKGNEKLEGLDFIFLPVISVAAIFTVIAGHFGCLLIAWTFAGGAILIVDQFLRGNDEDVWWKDVRFYTIVLLTIGAIAALYLWRANRLAFNFLVLLGMLAVSLAFVWFFSGDPGFLGKRSQLAQVITVAVFVILCISLGAKNGAKITIAPDDSGKIVVDVSAQQKNREIETIEYYWLQDHLLLDETREGFPKEKRLTDKKIPEQDGRLRVIVTDTYGAQAEQIYWVHYDQYPGGAN